MTTKTFVHVSDLTVYPLYAARDPWTVSGLQACGRYTSCRGPRLGEISTVGRELVLIDHRPKLCFYGFKLAGLTRLGTILDQIFYSLDPKAASIIDFRAIVL